MRRDSIQCDDHQSFKKFQLRQVSHVTLRSCGNYEHLVEHSMFAMSILHSTIGDNLAFSRSESLLPSKPDESLENTVSALELGGLAVLKPVIDRLVTTIARDAIDGAEVWKVIAFMLLDAIVQLSSLEKQHIVLSALTCQDVLLNFVQSLKDSDSHLQSVLKPDPDEFLSKVHSNPYLNLEIPR